MKEVGRGGGGIFAPFFARSLTSVTRSLFLNRKETLATQAIWLPMRRCSHFTGKLLRLHENSTG